MNCVDCFQLGQLAAVALAFMPQEVKEAPVACEQIQRARRSAQVVPIHDEPVPAVLDVLVMPGDRCDDARRAAVEPLERRPEHAFDARQLEHNVGVGIHARQLALRERAENAVVPFPPVDRFDLR